MICIEVKKRKQTSICNNIPKFHSNKFEEADPAINEYIGYNFIYIKF